MSQPIRNVAGIDDAPFDRTRDTRTDLITTVYCDDRLDGVIRTPITVDGADASDAVVRHIRDSRYEAHVRALLIQGVTVGGFNVIDLVGVAETLQRPVIAVCQQMPDLEAIREALVTHFPDGSRRWALIEDLPRPVAVDGCHAQWVGCDPATAIATVRLHTRYGVWPEPIRTAHLIAGGLAWNPGQD